MSHPINKPCMCKNGHVIESSGVSKSRNKCRKCNSFRSRKYYAANREKILSRKANLSPADKEHRNELARKWRASHKERVRATNKKFRSIHGEELRLNARKNYYANIDKMLKRRREYYAKNREREIRYALNAARTWDRENILARRRKWGKKNRDRLRAKSRAYRQQLVEQGLATSLHGTIVGIPPALFKKMHSVEMI